MSTPDLNSMLAGVVWAWLVVFNTHALLAALAACCYYILNHLLEPSRSLGGECEFSNRLCHIECSYVQGLLDRDRRMGGLGGDKRCALYRTQPFLACLFPCSSTHKIHKHTLPVVTCSVLCRQCYKECRDPSNGRPGPA